MNIQIEKYEEKCFYALIEDAIWLVSLAKDNAGSAIERTLVRTSVITCAASLECAANICTQSLSVPDMSTPTAKFIIYSNSVSKPLSKNAAEFEPIDGLRRIRNSLIHSKVKNHPITKGTDSEIAQIHPGLHQGSGLNNSPLIWSFEDALAVLGKLADFLKFYFSVNLQLDPKNVFELLATKISVAYEKPGYIIGSYWNDAVDVAKQKHNIDFSFLGNLDSV